MGIEAITLGLDGVILDTEAAHLQACNAAFQRCDLPLQWTRQQFREAARAYGASNALLAVIEQLSLAKTGREARQLMQEKQDAFREFALASAPAIQPGFISLMGDALNSGCKLAIVTDMPAQASTALLEQAFGDALTGIFAVVVTAANFGGQSDNGPFHLAMRTVGVDAANCVAIDTFAPGLRTAQRAGIWTVAATPYEKDVDRISGADIWCPQLQELRDLVGRRNTVREQAKRFLTFDGLRALKKGRLHDMPVLHQSVRLQASV